MTGGPLVGMGDLGQPATALIERVSDAIGGIAKPWQMKRTAKAEVEVELIKAEGKRKLTEIESRALERLVHEESRKQENIEKITTKSLNHLEDDSKPENLDSDWIIDFFEKCKNVSEDEMQEVWGRILADKSNGRKFSKRSLEIVASMEKEDALAFSRLCNFVVYIGGMLTPTVFFDEMGETLKKHGLTFPKIQDLEALGLIFFNKISGFVFQELSGELVVFYHDRQININLGNDKKDFQLGNIRLSKYGEEIAHICSKEFDEDFFEALVNNYKKSYTVECTKGNIVKQGQRFNGIKFWKKKLFLAGPRLQPSKANVAKLGI